MRLQLIQWFFILIGSFVDLQSRRVVSARGLVKGYLLGIDFDVANIAVNVASFMYKTGTEVFNINC